MVSLRSLAVAALCAVSSFAAEMPKHENAVFAKSAAQDALAAALLGGSADPDCSAYKDESSCHSDACSWCICSAVPSVCVTPEQAKKLPASVFSCS